MQSNYKLLQTCVYLALLPHARGPHRGQKAHLQRPQPVERTSHLMAPGPGQVAEVEVRGEGIQTLVVGGRNEVGQS